MSWNKVTRPLEGLKLKWAIKTLDAHSIQFRVNGLDLSPVIEVRDVFLDMSRKLLLPVDSLFSDDPLFNHRSAWWATAPKSFGELAGGLGILANQKLRMISNQAHCVPDDASELDCPFATGAIEVCPAGLWQACEALTRVQGLFLGIAEVLDCNDNLSIAWAKELVAAKNALGDPDTGIYWLTFFNVIGEWISEGQAIKLVGLSDGNATQVIELVSKDTKVIDGEVYPRVIKLLPGTNPTLN